MALSRVEPPCDVHVAADGVEALSFIDETRNDRGRCPDMILLDLNLPRISGHEVLDRIKSDQATCTIPVIVMSSSKSPADIQSAYRLHANSYLVKPHDLDDLFRVISAFEAFWLQLACLPTCA